MCIIEHILFTYRSGEMYCNHKCDIFVSMALKFGNLGHINGLNEMIEISHNTNVAHLQSQEQELKLL